MRLSCSFKTFEIVSEMFETSWEKIVGHISDSLNCVAKTLYLKNGAMALLHKVAGGTLESGTYGRKRLCNSCLKYL